MDTPIIFTPAQLFAGILAVCGAVTIIAGAINVIAQSIAKAKKPNAIQDAKLEEHEQKLKRISEKLDNDNVRLKSIEEGNKITAKTLLALIQHAIDGNDIEGMKKVKKELQEYLIDK